MTIKELITGSMTGGHASPGSPIDSGDCKTLELVTTELVRRPYDAEVCRSKGIFIKQHQGEL